MTPSVRAAVFASGSGTNLQALLDHETENGPYRIVVVISDREGAGALERAEAAGRMGRVIQGRGNANKDASFASPRTSGAVCTLVPLMVRLSNHERSTAGVLRKRAVC